MKTLVYHGSNMAVEKPDIIVPNRFLDFGMGFYTTVYKKQALDFAQKIVQRRKTGIATINIYEFDEENACDDCSVLRFKQDPDHEWLDFVTANRSGEYTGKQFDIIIGPVANDNVYRTIGLYMANVLTHDQAVDTLKGRELFMQIAFTTKKALSHLLFIGKEELS